MRRTRSPCCAPTASGHATALPSVAKNFRRPMWLAMRPSGLLSFLPEVPMKWAFLASRFDTSPHRTTTIFPPSVKTRFQQESKR
jgi:hypothetical protein